MPDISAKEGYEEQQSRKSREQEDRERDERHEKRVAKIRIEEERERLEQERAQSQGHRGPGPEFQIPHFQRQEHGSFRGFDQHRANFSDRRMPPPGMNEEQFQEAFRRFMEQQQFGGNQDGPRENYRRDDGQFRSQGDDQICHNWRNAGWCKFGNTCKFQHPGNDGDNYAPKRAKRN